MSSDDQFPAHDVLDWYTNAESMLADFLEYVPYCDSHEGVWSPKLVTILQETCSQVDSLWRWEAVHTYKRGADSLDITDYFELYGEMLAKMWLICWADEPRQIAPFATWQHAGEFKKEKYTPLDWWKNGYQKIKHNRLENRTCATVKHTANALAALFLAIVRMEGCWDGLWEKGWLSWDDSAGTPFNPFECLKEDLGLLKDETRCASVQMVIESKLFAYGVGLCSGFVDPKKEMPHWKGNSSRRFKAWYYNHCQNL